MVSLNSGSPLSQPSKSSDKPEAHSQLHELNKKLKDNKAWGLRVKNGNLETTGFFQACKEYVKDLIREKRGDETNHSLVEKKVISLITEGQVKGSVTRVTHIDKVIQLAGLPADSKKDLTPTQQCLQKLFQNLQTHSNVNLHNDIEAHKNFVIEAITTYKEYVGADSDHLENITNYFNKIHPESTSGSEPPPIVDTEVDRMRTYLATKNISVLKDAPKNDANEEHLPNLEVINEQFEEKTSDIIPQTFHKNNPLPMQKEIPAQSVSQPIIPKETEEEISALRRTIIPKATKAELSALRQPITPKGNHLTTIEEEEEEEESVGPITSQTSTITQGNSNETAPLKTLDAAEQTKISDLLQEAQHYGSIKEVLNDSKFQNQLPHFIEKALEPNAAGVPTLFSFSKEALTETLAVSGKDIKPLEMMNQNGQNLFIHAATKADQPLLELLMRDFPEEAFSIKEEILDALLQNTNADKLVKKFLKFVSKSDEGASKEYYTLLLHIAKQEKLDGFSKQFDALSVKDKKRAYAVAFTCSNPHIHEPADTPVLPNQYSINFMWINKKKIPDEQARLFGDEEEFNEEFIKPISEWILANPGTSIKVWYDQSLAGESVIKRVREQLETETGRDNCANVTFNDIRGLEVVQQNEFAFKPEVPVRYRSDLLRSIVLDHVLQDPQNQQQYAVYADLKVKASKPSELFDKKTMSSLDEFGFVMAKGGPPLRFENNFQILNKNNTQLIDSHKKVIIDLSLEKFKNALKLSPNLSMDKIFMNRSGMGMGKQEVIDRYPAMLTHLLQETEYASDEKKFDLESFRHDKFGIKAHGNIPLGDGKRSMQETMPRKPVYVPLSQFEI